MKVLFVCSGNACRSPAAEALLKKYNPAIEVDSAGTHAYYKIVDLTKDYLRHHNAEPFLKNSPEPIQMKTLQNYDLIIAMEPGHKRRILSQCPDCKDKIIVWHIPDPYFLRSEQAYRVFEILRKRVQAFAETTCGIKRGCRENSVGDSAQAR